MKILIVGGVAGGATTAARLRRIDEQSEIIIFERGEHISYANCGLPYYIGGTIKERERLFVQTPEEFENTFNIHVRVKQEVEAVDPDKKQITIKNLETGEEYTESYDKLVLSPGAEPVKPPIPGIESEGIFTLRNVPDTDVIKAFLADKKPRRAVIVGAGFIGLEMAENLHHAGLQVTIVEMAQQVMNVVDFEMAAEVHQHLKFKNVQFYLNDGVARFEKTESGVKVMLNSGRFVEADIVIFSIGVRPETKLAKSAGIKIGKAGGIVVDEYLQTSREDIYALGDAIEFANPITGKPMITYLAGPANKQGRIVADNIVYGHKKTYKGSINTAIAKVFDLTVASTGVPEKLLMQLNIPYQSIITHSSSHAGYYPDALPMTIKTIYHPETGQVLSGQIVGYDGVDKRIDLMATVVRTAGSIYDLTEIEHAYAPPFSSAKDPVNIAGFVCENVFEGRSKHIHWHEVMGCNIDEVQLVDVRIPEEFEIGTIDGAVNIPLNEVRNRLNDFDKNKTIVVFCGVGLRAYRVEQILRQNGFTNVFNLSGGYKTYEHTTQKQSNEDIFEKDFIGKDDGIYQVDPNKPKVVFEAKTIEVDACGLQCPGPVMRLKKEIEKMNPGDVLIETATDPGFAKDIEAWCKMTGNTLLELDNQGTKITAKIQKAGQPPQSGGGNGGPQKGTTLVVFSDALDKALASLVIANGAASAGKEVTMFFTFWGLSVIKKRKKPRTKKDFMGRMFSWMLPSHSKKLDLSKMNFGGMGAAMMRGRMKKLNVDSLEDMLQAAIDNGVKMVACQMSMDVMGVKAEEFIDGVEIGGVASYLERAEHSQNNLMIS